MASINGLPAKGHAIDSITIGGLRDRHGTLEMSIPGAKRLWAMDEAEEELLYTGAVVVNGVRREETFPVLVTITISNATPAYVYIQQAGPPRESGAD